MKKFILSAVAAFMAFTASATTVIKVADYAATSFFTADNNFSVTTDKGAGTSVPAYNTNYQDLRVYAKGTLTIEAGADMTSIILYVSDGGKAKLSAENSVDNGTVVTDSATQTVTWTGTGKKVVFTVGEYATLGTKTTDKGQLRIDSIAIEGGIGGTLAGAPLYTIDFTVDTVDNGWTIDNKVMPDSLSYVWTCTAKYGYKASAYVSGVNYATESWLISPVLDLTSADQAKFEFSHARKYGDLAHLSVKVTTDGTNWSTLTVPNWPDGSSWTYISSGEIDLTNYISATTQIAFVYTSTATGAATWEIESFEVLSGAVEVAASIANTPETAYTVSEAIDIIDAGKNLHETVYVIGTIDSIRPWTADQDTYKNIYFYITDGKQDLYVYRAYGLNKDSVASEAAMHELIKVGDEVIVCGTLTLYGTTYEFNQGCYIHSINKAEGIDEATLESEKAVKFVQNGVIYIRRNGMLYTIDGATVR